VSKDKKNLLHPTITFSLFFTNISTSPVGINRLQRSLPERRLWPRGHCFPPSWRRGCACAPTSRHRAAGRRVAPPRRVGTGRKARSWTTWWSPCHDPAGWRRNLEVKKTHFRKEKERLKASNENQEEVKVSDPTGSEIFSSPDFKIFPSLEIFFTGPKRFNFQT